MSNTSNSRRTGHIPSNAALPRGTSWALPWLDDEQLALHSHLKGALSHTTSFPRKAEAVLNANVFENTDIRFANTKINKQANKNKKKNN